MGYQIHNIDCQSGGRKSKQHGAVSPVTLSLSQNRTENGNAVLWALRLDVKQRNAPQEVHGDGASYNRIQ